MISNLSEKKKKKWISFDCFQTRQKLLIQTSHNSWSECCCKESRFVLTVPWYKVGSCGMIPNLDLKSSSLIFRNFNSIYSNPSTTLNRAWIEVDFLLPVRPTIPTFFPPWNVQVVPLRIIGRSGLYWTWRFCSSILPSVGHSGFGLHSSITRGASLGILVNWRILSSYSTYCTGSK